MSLKFHDIFNYEQQGKIHGETLLKQTHTSEELRRKGWIQSDGFTKSTTWKKNSQTIMAQINGPL